MNIRSIVPCGFILIGCMLNAGLAFGQGDTVLPAAPPQQVVLPDPVADPVEVDASFPGGMAALRDFMYRNLHYPEAAMEKNVQGRVYVEFTVGADGLVRDAKVKRGVEEHLDAEALRVIRRMPAWVPAQRNGRDVASRFVYPVTFMLEE